MDIIDIILAKKQAQGTGAALAAAAQQAIVDANNATSTANGLLDDAQSATEAANAASERAQAAAEIYDALLAITDEAFIAELEPELTEIVADYAVENVSVEEETESTIKTKKLKVRKKNIDNAYTLMKSYTTTGNNEDGTMTQKAITDAIAAIPTGSGNSGSISINADPGHLIVVGQDGELTATDLTEDDLIRTAVAMGTYQPKDALGLEIDYENKTFTRLYNNTTVTNFDTFDMFGGRKRCIVSDAGEIVAFHGQDNYVEDGTLGQVMVYQPKFYYLIQPTKLDGNKILKEIIAISSTKQAGLSLFPLFYDANGNELEYALLPAYEGCAYRTSSGTYVLDDAQTVNLTNDKLSSIAGAKPISGESQAFTVSAATKMASNRGQGWQITNLPFEALNQILMSIEFGTLNVQSAFYRGIVDLQNQTTNASCITGATAALGSESGMAETTTQTYGLTTETLTGNGKTSISYRGLENPYGNIWRFVGGVKVASGKLTYDDHTLSFALPTTSSWISAFGYDKDMSWAFLPVECTGANSSLPVGDQFFPIAGNDDEYCCVAGGKNSSANSAGPFYYGMDHQYNIFAYSYSARVMYIPAATNTYYQSNLTKWRGVR